MNFLPGERLEMNKPKSSRLNLSLDASLTPCLHNKPTTPWKQQSVCLWKIKCHFFKKYPQNELYVGRISNLLFCPKYKTLQNIKAQKYTVSSSLKMLFRIIGFKYKIIKPQMLDLSLFLSPVLQNAFSTHGFLQQLILIF